MNELLFADKFFFFSEIQTATFGEILVQVQEPVMGGGDRCAVYGCDNDPPISRQTNQLPHVGVLRFYSPWTKKEMAAWVKQLHRIDFKVTKSTKVCSNHFAAGYRCDTCWKPTLYMKGFPESNNNKKRPPPKTRTNIEKNGKRKQNTKLHTDPPVKKQACDSIPVKETWSFCCLTRHAQMVSYSSDPMNILISS